MTITIESFAGEDILSVNQFDRASLDAIFGIAHEMRVLVERFGGAELLQGQNSGQSLLRTVHTHQFQLYRRNAATRRPGNPHQQRPVQFRQQRGKPARHHPDP